MFEVTSTKRYVGDIYKHMKRGLSLVIREMQLKTTYYNGQ